MRFSRSLLHLLRQFPPAIRPESEPDAPITQPGQLRESVQPTVPALGTAQYANLVKEAVSTPAVTTSVDLSTVPAGFLRYYAYASGSFTNAAARKFQLVIWDGTDRYLLHHSGEESAFGIDNNLEVGATHFYVREGHNVRLWVPNGINAGNGRLAGWYVDIPYGEVVDIGGGGHS